MMQHKLQIEDRIIQDCICRPLDSQWCCFKIFKDKIIADMLYGIKSGHFNYVLKWTSGSILRSLASVH